LGEDTGETYSLILAGSVLSLICLHRNDLNRAEATADAALAQLAGTGARYRAQWALCARALILEADGKLADAFAALDECWDLCAQMGLTLEYRVLGPDLVRLALAVGDTVRARDVTASVAELAGRNDVASLTGAALRCQGLLDDDAEILQAAVAAYAASPRLLELGQAAEDAGAAFARQGRVDQAKPLLDKAIGIYERLDAARDLARTEAVLRGAGIRRGRRGTRSRPQYGWKSLTATEQNVARLVAEGLSNPQIGDRLFVSRRTVQTHLAHIFAKLGISSRAHLAAEVTGQCNSEPAAGQHR
jgi:DNA-binding CsgD family transcriptional regulator